jgi:hypothetical protein
MEAKSIAVTPPVKPAPAPVAPEPVKAVAEPVKPVAAPPPECKPIRRYLPRPSAFELTKSILATIPPPDFNTATATPEAWGARNASLSAEQRLAQRSMWITVTLRMLAKSYGHDLKPEVWAFTQRKRMAVGAAFDAGERRHDVLARLQSEFEAQASLVPIASKEH